LVEGRCQELALYRQTKTRTTSNELESMRNEGVLS
jgi:hypothetical protein